MKKLIGWIAMLSFLTAVPAFAGSGEKCSYDTQTCLNKLGAKKDYGWVGIELEYHDKDGKELANPVVKKLLDEGPAKAAGLEVGDVLIALNGAKWADKEAMKKAKGDWKIGSVATYTVARKGKEMPVAITLAKMPEQVFASMVGQHMISEHMVVATAAEATPAK